MKPKLTKLKRETDKSTIIVGNIITHTSLIDRRHKISKDIEPIKALSNNLTQLTYIEYSASQREYAFV